MTLNTQELKEQYVTACIEIGRLKSKLKEADEVIREYVQLHRETCGNEPDWQDVIVRSEQYLSQIDKDPSKDVTTRDTLSVDKEDNNE